MQILLCEGLSSVSVSCGNHHTIDHVNASNLLPTMHLEDKGRRGVEPIGDLNAPCLNNCDKVLARLA